MESPEWLMRAWDTLRETGDESVADQLSELIMKLRKVKTSYEVQSQVRSLGSSASTKVCS